MVTNRITFQEQSWIPNTREGGQAVYIPTAGVNNCLVPPILKEHKLYFNPHIISLMFTREPQLHTTWDVHWSVRPNTHNVD